MVSCRSCKKVLGNQERGVKFLCPGCGKHELARCRNCREIAAKYSCHECGFEGPN